MTLITFQDGKPVMRDGKVGTDRECCCGGGGGGGGGCTTDADCCFWAVAQDVILDFGQNECPCANMTSYVDAEGFRHCQWESEVMPCGQPKPQSAIDIEDCLNAWQPWGMFTVEQVSYKCCHGACIPQWQQCNPLP